MKAVVLALCVAAASSAATCTSDCTACTGYEDCVAVPAFKCTWKEEMSCRASTTEEIYKAQRYACADTQLEADCTKQTFCKWDRSCKVKASAPQTCTFDCTKCTTDGTCSEGGEGTCTWLATTKKCLSRTASCNQGNCASCEDSSTCTAEAYSNDAKCMWDDGYAGLCRGMTEQEKFLWAKGVCDGADTKVGCQANNLKKAACTWDGEACATSFVPKTCERSCIGTPPPGCP